jgi:hypothetical protein
MTDEVATGEFVVVVEDERLSRCPRVHRVR